MKLCGQCAAPLVAVCPACGTANPPENKFCGQCAAPLRTSDQARFTSSESYTPKHLADRILTSRAALEGERFVTVLFVDVSGFTALSEKLDPEDVRQLMDHAFELMLAEIHRYEGTVNQFLGDGLMALFGAPIAHEGHALRAVPVSPLNRRGTLTRTLKSRDPRELLPLSGLDTCYQFSVTCPAHRWDREMWQVIRPELRNGAVRAEADQASWLVQP